MSDMRRRLKAILYLGVICCFPPIGLQYRIAEIGWYNFEKLIQTLLKTIIGPGVTSFGGSKDGGRDAGL